MGKTVQATDDFLPSASERERSKAAVRETARDVGTGRRDDTLHIDVTSQVLIRLYLHATLTCMNKCSALRMCATKNRSKRTCSDTQAMAQTPGLTDGEVKFDAIADQVQEVDARKDKCEELERELMSAQVFFAFLFLPSCTWCPCVGACAFFNSGSASTPPLCISSGRNANAARHQRSQGPGARERAAGVAGAARRPVPRGRGHRRRKTGLPMPAGASTAEGEQGTT